MGNARQVAAVCIHAPSFSIPYPRQLVGGQTAARTIVLGGSRLKGADKAVWQEYKCTHVSRYRMLCAMGPRWSFGVSNRSRVWTSALFGDARRRWSAHPAGS
ncbi:hypothetical protein GEV38_13405 [Pseudomonas sp. 13159349]|nr:hypothetical protein CBP05_24475 [Pseudomonas putida]OUS87466.1 hypothetical protein CBP06_15005 [Pseudomonas putida]QKK96903.1 hypothetical protein GEV38_13405 [Pseudomonas sp. 13159349]